MVSLEQWQRMTPKQQWDLFVATDTALTTLRQQIAAPPVDELPAVSPRARRGGEKSSEPAEE